MHRFVFPRRPRVLSRDESRRRIGPFYGSCAKNYQYWKPPCGVSERSRGQIVGALTGKCSAEEIADGVMELPLRKLRPFRLIVVLPSERHVIEWRWNLEQLTMRDYKWRSQHWFSSGFDEQRAEVERQRVCDAALTHQSTKSLRWLRLLHRSHSPKRGPFSICMHRRDASTLSYTEVAVSGRRATMRYKSGPCCTKGTIVTRTISLVH